MWNTRNQEMLLQGGDCERNKCSRALGVQRDDEHTHAQTHVFPLAHESVLEESFLFADKAVSSLRPSESFKEHIQRNGLDHCSHQADKFTGDISVESYILHIMQTLSHSVVLKLEIAKSIRLQKPTAVSWQG